MIIGAGDMVALFMEALKWIYPERCIFCRDVLTLSSRVSVCGECREQVEFIKKPTCLFCGAPISKEGEKCSPCKKRKEEYSFDGNYSPLAYNFGIKDMLHDLKYRKKRTYVKATIDFLINESGGIDVDYFTGGQLLVPVPLHKKKLRERGFNQSTLIADNLSKLTGIKVCDALIRAKNTKPQYELNFLERQNNIKDAFVINSKFSVNAKDIILIDDIFTTGATLNECAKVLKESGAACVKTFTLSIARGGNSNANQNSFENI